MKNWQIVGIATGLALQAIAGQAATMLTPTPSEWASWPSFCRAKYAYLRNELASQFTPRVTQAEISQFESSMGKTWIYVHHYCASLLYWQQANIALTPKERGLRLKQATDEGLFTFVRIPTESAIYAEIATHLGTVARAENDPQSAERYFEIARTTHPDYPGGYQGLALLLEDKGNSAAARDILLEGNKATDGKSPEIHYFLGLVYVKLKNLDDAVVHARLAYQLGYPLPGLQQKLEAAGRSLD